MSATSSQPTPRLNVLMMPHQSDWAVQLPRLLEPQGVQSIIADDMTQALDVIKQTPIHAAVVDCGLPADARVHRPIASESTGLKLLQVIQRLDPAPPVVVVRKRQHSGSDDDRLLRQALKFDAFSVLDQPVAINQLLEALRRLIQRFYRNSWPTDPNGSTAKKN